MRVQVTSAGQVAQSSGLHVRTRTEIVPKWLSCRSRSSGSAYHTPHCNSGQLLDGMNRFLPVIRSTRPKALTVRPLTDTRTSTVRSLSAWASIKIPLRLSETEIWFAGTVGTGRHVVSNMGISKNLRAPKCRPQMVVFLLLRRAQTEPPICKTAIWVLEDCGLSIS